MRPPLGPQGPQPWMQSMLCNAWGDAVAWQRDRHVFHLSKTRRQRSRSRVHLSPRVNPAMGTFCSMCRETTQRCLHLPCTAGEQL